MLRVAAGLAVRTSDTVRFCNGSGRAVAIVKGSGAYMIGRVGVLRRRESGSSTDVVHEIGKARTTVVCDRNNLHEAGEAT
jgi:hypothetical protein